MYTTTALLALPFLTPQPRRAFLITIQAGLWAVGFAAIKLIPVILWVSEFKDTVYASSTYTLPYLHHILLGRYLHGSVIIPNQGGGWHEYGAYIGVIVLGLAIAGVWSKRRILKRGLLIAAGLAILASSTGPYLKPIFDTLPCR